MVTIIIVAIFFPSYTHPPKHYATLRERVEASSDPGRANLDDEKIFIATALNSKDSELPTSNWGKAVLDLVDILGPRNVYLSLYEDGANSTAADALTRFSDSVNCKSIGILYWISLMI